MTSLSTRQKFNSLRNDITDQAHREQIPNRKARLFALAHAIDSLQFKYSSRSASRRMERI